MSVDKTTEGLLNTAPVDWADRVEKWQTQGPGIDHFPPVAQRATMAEVIGQLDATIQKAARLRGYLEMRYGSGCGDQGHAAGVREGNKLVRQIRKVLGFTYTKSEVSF